MCYLTVGAECETNSCCCRHQDSIWQEEWYQQSCSWPPHTRLKHSFPLHKSFLSTLSPTRSHFHPHPSFLILFSLSLPSPPAVRLPIATFPSLLLFVYGCVSLSLSPPLRRISRQLPALCFSLCWQTLMSGPGTTQVRHKQVGGTGRERDGAQRTTRVTANARPPTHAHRVVDSLTGRHAA